MNVFKEEVIGNNRTPDRKDLMISFEELNDMAKEFILNIEDLCKVPVIMISTGPKREDTIIREYPLWYEIL